MVNEAATRLGELDAGIVYYGRAPDLARVAAIRCPLLLQHAGLDKRINAGLPAYEAALKAAKVRYVLNVYDGVDHAFNNDTSSERYNEAAAKVAGRAAWRSCGRSWDSAHPAPRLPGDPRRRRLGKMPKPVGRETSGPAFEK